MNISFVERNKATIKQRSLLNKIDTLNGTLPSDPAFIKHIKSPIYESSKIYFSPAKPDLKPDKNDFVKSDVTFKTRIVITDQKKRISEQLEEELRQFKDQKQLALNRALCLMQNTLVRTDSQSLIRPNLHEEIVASNYLIAASKRRPLWQAKKASKFRRLGKSVDYIKNIEH